MDIHPTHYQIMEMIRSVDDDGSGSIDFDEFLVLMQSRVGAGGPDQDLRNAFFEFDKSKTGFITKEDLKKTMMEFDTALTDEECNAMFREVDLDGDGKITFREFRELMVSHAYYRWCVCVLASDLFSNVTQNTVEIVNWLCILGRLKNR